MSKAAGHLVDLPGLGPTASRSPASHTEAREVEPAGGGGAPL